MASSIATAMSSLEDVDFFCKILKTPQQGSYCNNPEYPDKSTFHFRNHRAFMYLTHPKIFGVVQDLNEYQMVPSHAPFIRGKDNNTLWIPCIKYSQPDFNIDLFPDTPEGMEDFPGFIVESISKFLSTELLKIFVMSHLQARQERFLSPLQRIEDSLRHAQCCGYLSLGKDLNPPKRSLTPRETQFKSEVINHLVREKRNTTTMDIDLLRHSVKMVRPVLYTGKKEVREEVASGFSNLQSLADEEVKCGSVEDEEKRQIFDVAMTEMTKKFSEVMGGYERLLVAITNAKVASEKASKMTTEVDVGTKLDSEVLNLKQFYETVKSTVASMGSNGNDEKNAAKKQQLPPKNE